MQCTYKKEADRTILMIEDGKGPESGSFPVRMLCGGIIPGMLKCHLRNMDGNNILCFDVTSLQTLRITCEEKKLKYPALRVILESCIGMAERMEDYLMAPDQLLMDPDHIFVSPEKDGLFFAALPGKMTDVRQQLTEIMEFLLPVIDHGDREAMTAGYGFYRAVLSDTVPLSGLRKAVYKEQWGMEDELIADLQGERIREPEDYAENREDRLWDESFVREGYRKETVEETPEGKKHRSPAALLIPASAALVFLIMFLLFISGRTGALSMDRLIPVLAVCMALGGFTVKLMLSLKKSGKSVEPGYLSAEYPSDPAAFAPQKEVLSPEGSITEISMFQGYGSFRADLTEATYRNPERPGKTCALIPEKTGFPVIVMNEGSTMIGSLPGAADAVIRAPQISRIHARIQKKQEKISIIDLHSKNGTFVNDTPLFGEQKSLREGDSVRFADISYTVGTV